MAIKYTEEQLNTVDKSIIIQMFLNQQEELSKAVNQIEQLTKEVQSGNDKLQRMMEQIILSNNAMPASDVLPKRWIILTRFHLWK